MVLYHPTGEAMAVEQGVWQAALAAAEWEGWRPCGTKAPPEPLTGVRGEARAGEWTGGYVAAMGQEVTREDAWALGVALETAGGYEALAQFCRESGFLVCEGAEFSADLQRLGRRLEESAEEGRSSGVYCMIAAESGKEKRRARTTG